MYNSINTLFDLCKFLYFTVYIFSYYTNRTHTDNSFYQTEVIHPVKIFV